MNRGSNKQIDNDARIYIYIYFDILWEIFQRYMIKQTDYIPFEELRFVSWFWCNDIDKTNVMSVNLGVNQTLHGMIWLTYVFVKLF